MAGAGVWRHAVIPSPWYPVSIAASRSRLVAGIGTAIVGQVAATCEAGRHLGAGSGRMETGDGRTLGRSTGDLPGNAFIPSRVHYQSSVANSVARTTLGTPSEH